MNSWSNFDADEQRRPPSKNAGKQKTKRKGRDGKLYLRDGPKRPATGSNAKLARRLSTDASASSPSASVERKVRIEESSSGGAGKRTTTVRGLSSDAAKSVLRELKTALSVGGRVNARGEIEMQGAHAELILIKLQKAGYDDVRLAGGAGARSKAGSAPKWNAPKEVRARAEEQKLAARKAKQKQAERERAAARAPAAIAAKMLAQLRASEALEVDKLRRSDVPAAEKRIAREKLERILRRIEEVESGER